MQYQLAERDDGFAAGKEPAALDEHQVRSWTSWHRWTILALLACAFLPVLAAIQPDDSHPPDDQLIPLTRREIHRLFTGPREQLPAPATQLHWSRWRRLHKPPPKPATTDEIPRISTITKCRWSINGHQVVTLFCLWPPCVTARAGLEFAP